MVIHGAIALVVTKLLNEQSSNSFSLNNEDAQNVQKVELRSDFAVIKFDDDLK